MKIIKRTNDLPFFDQFFDGFFRDEPAHWMNQNTRESVNIKEDDNSYSIELMAPGFRKEDLQIEVEGKLLKLKAERKESSEDKDSKYLRREFRVNSFERQFKLPDNRIAEDQISARFEDGILFLELPKREEAKSTTRMIEVH